MRAKSLLRSLTIMLFSTPCGVAHAGGTAVSANGFSLREAALAAARQSASLEDRAPMVSAAPAIDASRVSDPLSYARPLGDTLVTLDFCTGAHLLTTNNLDAVTELVQHP